jgi:DNA invertase Pin-like site-specific DNA recombinase
MPVRVPRLNAEKPWKVLTFRKGQANLVGYARVSTREQTLDVQLSRLQAAGCSKVYAEKVSGAAGNRPGWSACVEALRPGDVLVVLRVDRMGRRLAELVRSMDEIRDLGAHVRSLEEGIDTSQRGGRFAFNVIASLAEKVRDDIRDNTRAGLAELKRKGRKLGRPTKLEPAKLAQLEHLRGQGFSLREIGAATGLGRTTVMRGLELAAHVRGDPRQMKLGGLEG